MLSNAILQSVPRRTSHKKARARARLRATRAAALRQRLAKLRVPQGRPHRDARTKSQTPQVGASRAQGGRVVGWAVGDGIRDFVERAQSSLAKSGPRAASTHGAGTLLRCSPIWSPIWSPRRRREALGTGRAFPSRRRLSTDATENLGGGAGRRGPTRLDTMSPGVLMGAGPPRERGKIFDGAN